MTTSTLRFHRDVSDAHHHAERVRAGADFTIENLDRVLRALEGNLDHALRLCSDDDEVSVERRAKDVDKNGNWVALTLRLTAPLTAHEIAMTAAAAAKAAFLLHESVAAG